MGFAHYKSFDHFIQPRTVCLSYSVLVTLIVHKCNIYSYNMFNELCNLGYIIFDEVD